MTLIGIWLTEGTLKSQTGCSQVCFPWSAQGFYILKNVLPTFKDQDISQKKSGILDFPFKTRSSGCAVQCSHVAEISRSGRRAAPCRQAGDSSPPDCPTTWPYPSQPLEAFKFVTPAPKQWFSPEGFIRITWRGPFTLPRYLHPKYMWRTTASNSIQSISEIEKMCYFYLPKDISLCSTLTTEAKTDSTTKCV